ncbi:hypothetical protein NPX13_g9930 [Xylaria arbuscula]|uniref:Uncharacterized protein n=1 Tax=Xylaria arbuscula TaxID=114810 RepID=A0A9W8N5T2_9PEZI|nr:hypothetical protein NPX13_g9930 [Xylaria arbuscula]
MMVIRTAVSTIAATVKCEEAVPTLVPPPSRCAEAVCPLLGDTLADDGLISWVVLGWLGWLSCVGANEEAMVDEDEDDDGDDDIAVDDSNVSLDSLEVIVSNPGIDVVRLVVVGDDVDIDVDVVDVVELKIEVVRSVVGSGVVSGGGAGSVELA